MQMQQDIFRLASYPIIIPQKLHSVESRLHCEQKRVKWFCFILPLFRYNAHILELTNILYHFYFLYFYENIIDATNNIIYHEHENYDKLKHDQIRVTILTVLLIHTTLTTLDTLQWLSIFNTTTCGNTPFIFMTNALLCLFHPISLFSKRRMHPVPFSRSSTVSRWIFPMGLAFFHLSIRTLVFTSFP